MYDDRYVKDACPTFQPIDDAIARLPKGWASIGIDLCWPDYDQLLRLYGIRARAEDIATWGGGEYLTRRRHTGQRLAGRHD